MEGKRLIGGRAAPAIEAAGETKRGIQMQP
jgi:hypothetical protein